MSSKLNKNDISTYSRKRKTLFLKCKLDIIKAFDGKMKICELPRKFKLSESTVIKDKQKILNAVKSAQSLNSSKILKCCVLVANMETMLNFGATIREEERIVQSIRTWSSSQTDL